ncbi:MAG: hypothetical protein OH337_03815 [Candidatus Parvarchaeota archaeon]|nr:hypothetical protein [Candidatus Haiyanarchaeum thermophilum]
MPRRRKSVAIGTYTPIPGENYWDSYLKMLNLVGESGGKVQAPTPTVGEAVSEEEEIKIFVDRVAENLCPPEKGIPEWYKKKVRDELMEVFEGKRELGEWFDKVRTELNLKTYQVADAVYRAFEGLRSEGAREMRRFWEEYLRGQLKGYGLLG